MAGATGSDQDMVVGRTNWADGRTILWAKVPPDTGNFWGDAILIVEVAKNPVDPDDYEVPDSFVPSNRLHGIVAVGHSGGGASNFGGTKGAVGVIGRGGRNEGTGVVGLGGGNRLGEFNSGAGGIGVHGLGGSESDFGGPATPPGAGVIGQGGRQHDTGNILRLPHGAGVIGIGGGTGPKKDVLPAHTLMETGGVGVYAQGAEATRIMVPTFDEAGNKLEPTVPSGPLAPGAGMLGRGGVPIPPLGPVAAGVIGLAGGVPIPNISETGNTGVYGAGPTGVFGHGQSLSSPAVPTGPGVRGLSDSGPAVHGQSDSGPAVRGGANSGRGGMFESARSAQVQLVPQKVGVPFPAPQTVTPTAIPAGPEGVQLPKDGQGGDLLALMDAQRQCALWFCVRGQDDGGPAQWAQVLLGPSFAGRA